jgi:hypothetical protein
LSPELNRWQVPDEFITKSYKKLNGTTVYGVDACIEEAYGPFKNALAKDWKTGWDMLMKVDHHSTRSYMINVMKYPWPVVQWMERSDDGTAGFDHLGFSEVSRSLSLHRKAIALTCIQSIMESLEFDYPTGVLDSEPKEIPWRCIEGGTENLPKAMYESLKFKENLQTGKRVTLIRKVTDLDVPEERREVKVAGHKVRLPVEIEKTKGPFTIMAVISEDDSSQSCDLFSHVISTVPLACLRSIDLSKCGLDYEQKMALRSLHYGPAVKVGIKFKERWWKDSNRGGMSKTDRQSRVVVYPSYGLDDKEDQGVLIASYNWYVFFFFAARCGHAELSSQGNKMRFATVHLWIPKNGLRF